MFSALFGAADLEAPSDAEESDEDRGSDDEDDEGVELEDDFGLDEEEEEGVTLEDFEQNEEG